MTFLRSLHRPRFGLPERRPLAPLLALAGWVAGALVISGLPTGPAMAEETSARAVETPRAVVELFTSQGCSSCPPADKLLGEIAEQGDVLALTLAVDYWDYLGWKDTLARHGHSLRQKAYAKLRGDGKMFTPQAIVNGTAMAVGSDRAGLERALSSAPALNVPVGLKAQGERLVVDIGSGPENTAKGDIWLCPVQSRAEVDIGRGENEGVKIGYHNVVHGWTRLGSWDGKAARFEASLAGMKEQGADSVAVLVQTGSATQPGSIIGAGLIPLR